MDDAPETGMAPLGAAGKASLLMSTLLAVYAIVGLTTVLPKIAAHFADTPDAAALVRLLFTSVSLAMIFGAPLGITMAGRFGRRPVLIVAICTYAVAGAIGAFLDNLWLLIASRFVLGVAAAAISTLHITILLSAFPEPQRNRWLGLFSTVGTLGAMASFAIAGALGGIDWRLPFLLHLIAIPQLILVLIGIPDSPIVTAQQSQAARRAAGLFPWLLVAISLVTGIVAGGSPMFLPFHLADIGETDPKRISLGLLVGTLVSAAAALGFATIRTHLSIGRIFCLAFALAGAGLAGVGAADDMMAIIIAQIAAGAGLGLLSPALYGLVAVTGRPEDRARNTGFVKSAYYGAPFLAQMALEPVAKIAAAGGALIALGSFGIVMAGLFLFAKSRQPSVA
jgi:MFS family permease